MTSIAFDIPRSESLRMEETALAASSALERKESWFSSTFAFGFFLFSSATFQGGNWTFSKGGFQTVIGITTNNCSAAAFEGLLAPLSGLEEIGGLKITGASAKGDEARSGSRAVGDAPNF